MENINLSFAKAPSRSLLLYLRVTLSELFWWHAAVLCYSDVCRISERCCRCIMLTPRINIHESAVPLHLLTAWCPCIVSAITCLQHLDSWDMWHTVLWLSCQTCSMSSNTFQESHKTKCYIPLQEPCQWVSYRQSILWKERSSHPSGWSTLGSHCYSLGY